MSLQKIARERRRNRIESAMKKLPARDITLVSLIAIILLTSNKAIGQTALDYYEPDAGFNQGTAASFASSSITVATSTTSTSMQSAGLPTQGRTSTTTKETRATSAPTMPAVKNMQQTTSSRQENTSTLPEERTTIATTTLAGSKETGANDTAKQRNATADYTDEYEPNDDISRATIIDEMPYTSRTLAIYPKNETDYYRINATKNCKYTIRTTNDQEDLDTEIWLYTADDPLKNITYNDDAKNTFYSQIEHTPRENARLYVKVKSMSGLDSGAYRLEINQACAY